ncbi:MAG: DUF4956 domain-containing protein [Gemmataceae bacterium]|nr:DUF4956 domain-containing protein [Gemmataceae bacterium]
MPDAPPDPFNPAPVPLDPLPPVGDLIGRVGLALALGFVVALVYRLTLRRENGAGGLPTTLVLLTALISLVTLVIGNSTARAFGLVGALSIVRFRTVVEDTRDTAFVIFAVVVGMAAGAGYLVVAAVGIPGVALGAAVMRYFDRPAGPPVHALTVRVGPGEDPTAALTPVFARLKLSPRLTGVGTAKQGTAVEYVYAVPVADPVAMAALVAEVHRVEGVQGVELRD